MPRASRGLIVAVFLLTVAGASLVGSAGKADGGLLTSNPPTIAERFHAGLSRVVSARVRHTRLSPVRNSNARRIGRALATLRPTWVSGTLRYARNQYPKRDEVRAWHELQRIVRAQSPAVQFDLVLNGLQYRTPTAIRRVMNRLRAKLHPNGWFFDFFSSAYTKHGRMVKAAIASAHTHGEWIGGNVFGLAKERRLPASADFYSVQDHVFHLDLPAVKRLAAKKPVVYHLNSNPAHPRSGGCRFIQRFDTLRRQKLVRRRAAQQVPYGFRMSYPVLFPQCLRPRQPGGSKTYLKAYNAFRDPPMAQDIRELLDSNDFDPGT